MTKGRATCIKILRIALPFLLTALWIAFIWSNSLKNGAESGEDSGRVFTAISKITSAIGLGTPISEHFIRKAAHFSEFAILGALFCADLVCLRAVSFKQRLYISAPLLLCSVPTSALFAAAEEFARVEGILPAPESSHAIKVALDIAKECIKTGEEKTIVFGLTGTGYFDMMSYEKFHNGIMTDYTPSDEEINKALSKLPTVE